MKKLIFALIAGTAAMTAAQAQTATPRAYVGVGVATAESKFSVPGASNQSDPGYKASGKIFGGYEFDQMWGAEVGYTDFRNNSANYNIGSTAGNISSEGHSWYLAGKATMPINEQFAGFAKLGVVRNSIDISSTTAGLSRSDSNTGAYGALGVEYKFNQNVSLTAEYERYGKSRDQGVKPDVWTVAAKYSF
ncbi:MAG: porin family protein [Massilia sp.]